MLLSHVCVLFAFIQKERSFIVRPPVAANIFIEMVVIIATIILIIIIGLLINSLRSNIDRNSSVPYVTYRRYPIIGHLLPFLHDRINFFKECQRRYGPCFKIQIFSQSFIIILSPLDWTNILRNPAFYFSAHDFSRKIFDAETNILSDHPEFDVELHRQFTLYLKNRDGLRPLVSEFVRRIRQQMQGEKAHGMPEWKSSGLLEFSHRMIFQSSTLALFGEIQPHLLEDDFRLFDEKFHYFNANIPPWIFSWLFSKELKARSRLNHSWLTYSHSLSESDYVQARVTLFQENSDWFSSRDYGGNQTGLLWASLGNTIPAVFWSLFYILQDPRAIETITQEIDTYLPFVNEVNDDEEWTLEQLNSCVYLESAVNETLRLAGAPLMIRKCRQETETILQDGRILRVRPEETLAHFVGLTHSDENLFPEPEKFLFDRFVKKNADSIPGFMPFGGGKSMCPGRFFAKNEMKICLALLLRYIECQFVDPGKIPKQKLDRIGFGVAPPNQDIPILYRYKK